MKSANLEIRQICVQSILTSTTKQHDWRANPTRTTRRGWREAIEESLGESPLLQQDRASIQAVVAASDTLSRQFVKVAATIPGESIVDVIGVIKEPIEPIKSATVSGRELHVTELWIVEKAIPQLPVQPDDSEFALPSEAAGAAEEQQSSSDRPLVGLSTRLDNRVLDLRASLNQDI